jgi:hypothetical protein
MSLIQESISKTDCLNSLLTLGVLLTFIIS